MVNLRGYQSPLLSTRSLEFKLILAGLLAFPDLSPSQSESILKPVAMMRQIINWKLQLRGQLRIYTEFPFNANNRWVINNHNLKQR